MVINAKAFHIALWIAKADLNSHDNISNFPAG